jgi:hypothetical protein
MALPESDSVQQFVRFVTTNTYNSWQTSAPQRARHRGEATPPSRRSIWLGIARDALLPGNPKQEL